MTDPTTPASDASDDVAAALRAELDRAQDATSRLQAEYDQLVADGDTIQEDRDSVRQYLEEARGDLQSAERAMARYQAGEYGICGSCGSPIDAERLQAIPGIETCRSCSA